jgi:RiboL-PSP-HEPN
MPSNALGTLATGLAEIRALQLANPSPAEGSGLKKPAVVRAIGRSEVVLLSSHFERYLYAVNQEAVDAVCNSGAISDVLPERLKLEHSRQPIEIISSTAWEHRASVLRQYSAHESWLWSPGTTVSVMDADRLLMWMKAPTPQSLMKAFRLWGIEDVFGDITRTPVNRARLWLKLGELVDKRNNIAHGDSTIEATYLDVVQYISVVRKFCESVDKRLARQLRSLIGSRPW